MKSTFLTSTAALLLGSCVYATANPANATEQCVFSLMSLFGDQGFKSCMPLSQMTQLLSGNFTPQTVNETTAALCSLPVCSQETITLVENTISQNCIPGGDPNKTVIVGDVLSLYPPARQGLCQTEANGTYCTTLVAQNFTNYFNDNPPPGLNMTAGNRTEWRDYLSNIPSDLLCTDCTKAMLSPIDSFITQNRTTFSPTFLGWVESARTEVKNKCGDGFLGNSSTPGNTPSTPASRGTNGNAASVSVETSLVLGLICSIVAVGAQFI
ncbi:hypothetical protein BGZ51_003319 [Haplosporangium sp. Z 767]|nr:hypothetical protein BGZ51_003319 [Haplosporangium sp. Z 767]KAF9191330.1 hypothetical protein BGZ50_009448 [Haplosporangium sp. Z 11]